MTKDKMISMQELAKTYYDSIGEGTALLKVMEECGELVRATSKFISQPSGSGEEMQLAFSHMISECIDVYITLMWLFGTLDKERIQQDIGMRLVEVLNKLELTQKLALDESVIQIEHGLPIGVRIENVKIDQPGLKIV